MKKVSEILKEFRKNKKITQPELGQMLSVSQQYISLVETNKSQLSEDALNTLKKLMDKDKFEELEQAFYFEKMPDKLRDLLKSMVKIPYFRDIKASAGTGYLNFCEEIAPEYLEIEKRYNYKNCIAINIQGDSMWPELQDSDIVIVDCNSTFLTSKGYFIVQYRDEIFAKKLILAEGEIVGLKSVNPMYKDIEISKDQIKIIGKIESVYREFFN